MVHEARTRRVGVELHESLKGHPVEHFAQIAEHRDDAIIIVPFQRLLQVTDGADHWRGHGVGLDLDEVEEPLLLRSIHRSHQIHVLDHARTTGIAEAPIVEDQIVVSETGPRPQESPTNALPRALKVVGKGERNAKQLPFTDETVDDDSQHRSRAAQTLGRQQVSR
jgi:hypothetical protein